MALVEDGALVASRHFDMGNSGVDVFTLSWSTLPIINKYRSGPGIGRRCVGAHSMENGDWSNMIRPGIKGLRVK